MAPTIPTTEPTTFRAGTSWKWDKTFGDFPASDGWQLTYYLRSLAGGADITLAWATEVTADGDTFQVRAGASKSAELDVGAYDLIAEVTDGTDTYTPLELRVTVIAGAAASGAKSHAATMVAAIEARQQGRALTQEQKRVQINGRSIEYADDQELVAARAHWLYILQLEQHPGARLATAARFVNG